METIKKLSARSIILISIQIVVIYMLVGCSKSSTTGPATNEVFMQSMAFSPATLTVSTNTKVTWTNKDAVVHNVTSTTGLFSSGSLSNGATYSFTFTSAGTYNYLCTIHPTMTAKIIVQ
jgi:plastocyanin